VIIQDLRLGTTRDPQGLDIVKLAHRRCPETRIIIFTAYGSAEIEGEAIRCGADVFLRKPKPLSQVAQVVKGLIEITLAPTSPHEQVTISASRTETLLSETKANVLVLTSETLSSTAAVTLDDALGTIALRNFMRICSL
jgi:ActR/RegA family two-component response regulator